jgi:hypothetical protein
MNSKTLFIFDSIKLFEILNEIKGYLNFEIAYIEQKKINETDFSSFKDYLVISLNSCNQFSNFTKIDKEPKKIDKLIQIINLNFIKNQFAKQSNYKIGKYNLDVNSRVISYKKNNLDLTEKEIELLLFINQNKKVNLKIIQANVWGYGSDLETHTVETHIYRLRKKIKEVFQDENFLEFENGKYFLV